MYFGAAAASWDFLEKGSSSLYIRLCGFAPYVRLQRISNLWEGLEDLSPILNNATSKYTIMLAQHGCCSERYLETSNSLLNEPMVA
ncbi:Hypothetical protein NTJ_12813 [Nesidiocoris tenuis]|uniref:Uncharacterized protein n=1 Tax=Nesidiocoris tenuis TaxID=355587 RepID=A0ABN7B806_9HEMI|nr:Hypothetical protein NTJ_12813 [Nesidiocoris tenuis]